MRGNVAEKLKPFLQQVNTAVAEAKRLNLPYQVETTRQNLENLSQFLTEKPNVNVVEDRVLQVDERSIPVRVYNPNPALALPVIIHYHGGGHMCGSLELYDPICRKLATNCEAIVIAVDYRLAPEYPYPAGIEDSELALANYQQVVDDMLTTDEVIIAGDSAGGAICSTLAMKSLKNPKLKIDKQILIYPSVDYTMSANSVEENGNGFLLEKEKVVWYFNEYFQKEDTLEIRKAASPLFGDFSAKMPKTLIFTAGCDPLRDEGISYVQKLRMVNASVEQVHLGSMIHAFMLLHDLVPEECNEVYKAISGFVKPK